jgi:hypothetical protein
MSTRSRPKPPRQPAPRPLRRRQRDAPPIPPEGDVFDWRPEVEIVVGGPRPARKAQERAKRSLFARLASRLCRPAQPAPLDAGHPLGESEEQIKATIAARIRGAFDEGVQAERKRIGEIMAVPGAATFPDLAVDLAVGGATASQVAAVLSRTEVNVQARLHPTESSSLESSTPTLH